MAPSVQVTEREIYLQWNYLQIYRDRRSCVCFSKPRFNNYPLLCLSFQRNQEHFRSQQKSYGEGSFGRNRKQEINFGRSDVRMTMTSLVYLHSAASWEPPLTEPNRIQRGKKRFPWSMYGTFLQHGNVKRWAERVEEQLQNT